MPKPKRARPRPVGIVAGDKGRKTTFADDSDGDESGAAPEAGPSRLSVPRAAFSKDDEDEDEDSDDAPEAVGLALGKEHRVEEEQREAERARQKRQAARLRSDKIAALKAKQKEEAEARARKAKRKPRAPDDAEDEDEDEATMRLRRRMEAAMADGEDESDDDVSGNESDHIDEDEEDDMDEDDEDEDEEDDEQDEEDEDEKEGDQSDYSETLEDGPLTDVERKMRERMQAAMEAAEVRAGLAPRKPKSALKQTSSAPIVTATAADTQDAEEESFDLTPYHSAVKPLPQHVLDAAARAQAEKKAAQATVQSAKPNDRALKRKRQRQKAAARPAPSSRALSDDKTLHLLPTVLDTNSPLPPVIKPGALRTTGVRNTFIKTAMKKSGVGVPGRGLVDGRRRKGASLFSSAR